MIEITAVKRQVVALADFNTRKLGTGKMPVPQDNLFIVEQASCLFLICCGTGILPVSDLL
ncbi:hypothetical protein [Microcoleus sp. A003_D6]|uniref:hypothetical protein n=1 Tax=Microcoleus sp. A003_D6 TaxID=3055266 RepID=UPI002FD61326